MELSLSLGAYGIGRLYITIFINQDLILQNFHKLKSEYVVSLYSDSWEKWLYLAIFPLISSFLITWIISILEFTFFKKHKENSYKKIKEDIRQKREITKEQSTLSAEEEKILQSENRKRENTKKIQSEMSMEEKWDIEYEELKRDYQFSQAMKELREAIYQRSGNINRDPELIAYIDLNNLVNFTNEYRNNIELTEKGKYMLKIFTRKSEIN